MDFQQFLEEITKPGYIIAYVVIIVLILVAVVVLVMLNERRLRAAAQRMDRAARKVEEAQEEVEEEEAPSRFSMLKEYDEHPKPPAPAPVDISLKELCEEFRIFAAGKLGLFYDISAIREFIAGLAVSHILILQGMSGTGKTSLAYAFGEFIGNPSAIIPVQPMWKERTDLLGYYNEFTKHFNETLLLQKMYEANGREEMYIVILDELNIARVEYYFAEFLSMLEIPNPESRYLDVVSDRIEGDPKDLKNGRIRLPENMWFIGTANNDDSTFAISDKVYDRAMVLNLDKKFEPFQASGSRNVPLRAEQFTELAAKAVEEHPVSEDSLEKLQKLDGYLIDKFHLTFGNRIMRQIRAYLPIYVACGGEEMDALDDIIAKKVFRKLETQNAAHVRSESQALIEYIDSIFGEDRMLLCKEYVRRIAAAI